MATDAQLADRLEIESVLARYAWALDAREFDLLDDVFTPDAFLDYTTAGGIKGNFPEVKAWLTEVLPYFPAYQHLVSNIDVTFDGDTATAAPRSTTRWGTTVPTARVSTSTAAASTATSGCARTRAGASRTASSRPSGWTERCRPSSPAPDPLLPS